MLDISYPDKPTKLVYPLETATPPKPKPTFYCPEDDDDFDVYLESLIIRLLY